MKRLRGFIPPFFSFAIPIINYSFAKPLPYLLNFLRRFCKRKLILGRAGFTFIELMLAASIFAIVALAIYSTFGSGISVWKKTEKTQNLYQDIRLVLNKMAYDLENAVLYSEPEEEEELSNFAGERNEISFFTIVDVFQKLPTHQQLRRIAYSLDESTRMLLRQELTYPESVQEAYEKEPEEIAAHISNLTFFYYYENKDDEPPYEWMDSWDPAQGIPQGVKIELEVEAEEELIFTKYVFIPTGKKGQEQEE